VTVQQTYNITEVIGCAVCKSDEDGKLFIGQPAKAVQVQGLTHCPSCQTSLRPDDIVAVGIDTRARCAQEIDDAA